MEIFAKKALLPQGWATNVALTIDAGGVITALTENSTPVRGQDPVRLILPGMVNTHSHAFQRAFAGLTESHDGRGGDFWSWRKTMYGMLRHLTVADVKNIARHLYIELLKGGYTSIAEFHYLHHLAEREEVPGLASASALSQAADDAGIAFTLLPTLYRYANFGGAEPLQMQKPFLHDINSFLELISAMNAQVQGTRNQSLGVAFHSLRAVTPHDIHDVIDQLKTSDQALPKHIHLAEQEREVRDCLAHSSKKPIEFFMENVDVDATWTLVHATHCSPEECELIAQSGALVALCPTTEANLGDGFFPVDDFLRAGGRTAIGSDAHVCTQAAEELRMLDTTARLVNQARAGALQGASGHVGTALWSAAARNGATACGRNTGLLEVGARADLITLDLDHPQLTGRSSAQVLDTFIFGGCGRLVRDVMVGGTWVVREGKHPFEAQAISAYKSTLAGLF